MKHLTRIALLTLGLIAGGAQAQSGVKLYGVIDAFAGSMRSSGDPGRTTVLDTSGLTTSYWGISAGEALGDGLNAEFALESFFQTDTGASGRFNGDAMFGRNAYVGLNGTFGGIRFGRNTTPWFVSMLLFNPLTDSAVFSPMFLHTYTTPPGAPVGHTIAGDTAWNNSVLYQSPEFSGLRFNAIYSTGEVPDLPGQQNYGANLIYFGGDFSATVALQRVGVADTPELSAAGAKSQTAYLAGAAYDFKAFKLFGQYALADNRFDTLSRQRDRTIQVGASAPLGAGLLMVEWARTRHEGNGAISSERRDTAAVVYDYSLSKRTDVYAAWRHDKVSDLQAGNTFGVGLRQRF